MLILYSCIDNENLNRLVIYNLEKEKEKEKAEKEKEKAEKEKAEKEKVVAVREKEVAALKAQVDEITKKFNTLVPRSIIGISFTLRCIISPYSI
jgi:hypothetical protein